MSIQSRRVPASLSRAMAIVLLALLVAAPTFAKPSNKWRVEMDGRAKVDGEIELSIAQGGGEPTVVVIAIPKGTSENAAARIARDRLREVFGKDVYQVEVDDGEDVLIKAKRGTRDFDLVLVRNTADGLRLDLERE